MSQFPIDLDIIFWYSLHYEQCKIQLLLVLEIYIGQFFDLLLEHHSIHNDSQINSRQEKVAKGITSAAFRPFLGMPLPRC